MRFPRFSSLACVALGVALALLTHAPAARAGEGYLDAKRAHRTRLTRQGPSPQQGGPISPPPGVQEVIYDSGGLKLKAWFAMPKQTPASGAPAVVYYHGGFAMGAGDWSDAQPFFDAGFAVLVPMLRGENGNPGYHELYYGEVDDGIAAAKWLADRAGIDAGRIYGFGHSAGGAIAALASLYDDTPFRATGSSGGIYNGDAIASQQGAPFDVKSEEELKLRSPIPYLDELRVPHVAIMGAADGYETALAKALTEAGAVKGYFALREVPGDHFASLRPAISLFLEVIAAVEAGKAGLAPTAPAPAGGGGPSAGGPAPSTRPIASGESPDPRTPEAWYAAMLKAIGAGSYPAFEKLHTSRAASTLSRDSFARLVAHKSDLGSAGKFTEGKDGSIVVRAASGERLTRLRKVGDVWKADEPTGGGDE